VQTARTILVTGSAGLIGSETVRHFAGAGFAVVGIDNDMRSRFFGAEASTRKTRDELRAVSENLRASLIDSCSRTGGHIGAGLGVVELTVALHHVFDTPRDQLVWDVGHQAYPHKMLTGRRDQFETLRQQGGISGFLKRDESEYDVFGAGHAATAISAALGVATARDLKHEDFRVLAVLGDGALTSGLSYEGLNNAGASDRDAGVSTRMTA